MVFPLADTSYFLARNPSPFLILTADPLFLSPLPRGRIPLHALIRGFLPLARGGGRWGQRWEEK